MDFKDLINPDFPILLAGPTASGKSSLALELARTYNGVIINADALQVYSNWRVLTARPSEKDERSTPHFLYGHIGPTQPYSVGHWLTDIKSVLKDVSPKLPIIVGGNGLYFSCLTNGLADIPKVDDSVRVKSEYIIETEGHAVLAKFLEARDPETWGQIDLKNPVRIQRAWEVLTATGKGLAAWQKDTSPPLLPISHCNNIVINSPKVWLNPRIDRRFGQMVTDGGMQECQANMSNWNPSLPSSKAIGAAELISHLQGAMTIEKAVSLSVIATQQYAKRQRSWFRSKMKTWNWVDLFT